MKEIILRSRRWNPPGKFAVLGRSRGRRGMTLIEILVGLAVSSILLVSAYGVYSSSIGSWEMSRRRIEMQQRGRAAIDRIAVWIRSAEIASSANNLVFEGTDLVGTPEGMDSSIVLDADTLRFRTNAPISMFEGRADADQTEVELFMNSTEDPVTKRITTTLSARIDPGLDTDPTEGGWIVELASDILQINFRYYDGVEWADEWASTSGAPRAIEAAIAVGDPDGKEPAIQIARLIAPAAWRDTSGGGTQVQMNSGYSFDQQRGSAQQPGSGGASDAAGGAGGAQGGGR